MKNASLITKIWMLAVTLGVLAYFGVQIYRYANDPFTTTLAYAYRVEQTVELSGSMVRQEQVIAGDSSGYISLRRAEGERVSANGIVAAVYADQSALDRQNEVQTLRDRIEQLEFAQDSMLGAEATLKLDSQISQALLDYRSALAADRLDTAETYGRELRSLVLKRDYSYSGTDDLTGQIQELKSQLRQLTSQTSSSVRTIRASRSGLFSGVVDGYESVLTPAMLGDLTPSALDALTPGDTSGIGRLILGDDWYYVAAVQAADAEAIRDRSAKLASGESLHLRFTKNVDRDLEVELVSVGAEENGRCVVVLRGSQYLQELTLVRRQSAQVVLQETEGIRVPRSALRVGTQTETITDEATGEETTKETSVTGVYCVSGAKARFKPTEVLYTGEDYAVVRPTSDGEKLKLRPGDQVIVTARDLYDGKVVS